MEKFSATVIDTQCKETLEKRLKQKVFNRNNEPFMVTESGSDRGIPLGGSGGGAPRKLERF